MIHTEKISSWVLWTLSIVTIGVLVAFYFGGDGIHSTAEMWEPKNTDFLIDWSYIILGIGVIVVILFSICKFFKDFINQPKRALKSLFDGIVVILLLGACWFIGDGTTLNIIGYEGNENVYFWLKWTDMLLYASYFLIVVALLGIFISRLIEFKQK